VVALEVLMVLEEFLVRAYFDHMTLLLVLDLDLKGPFHLADQHVLFLFRLCHLPLQELKTALPADGLEPQLRRVVFRPRGKVHMLAEALVPQPLGL